MTKPVRTCVCCRARFAQKSLLRFSAVRGGKNGESAATAESNATTESAKTTESTESWGVKSWENTGRSLYLCLNCVENKDIYKALCRAVRSRVAPDSLNILKEMATKWQKNNFQK